MLLWRIVCLLIIFHYLLIHISSCTINNTSLWNSIIWIVVWILILTLVNLLLFLIRMLDGLICGSKICNIPALKFSICLVWLMRLIIFTLVLIHNLARTKISLILNLLLVLTGIHCVSHVYSCSRQKACGFVHLLLILSSRIFFYLLS